MPTTASDYTISGSNTLTTPSISFSTDSFTFAPFSTDHISKASISITIQNIERPR